MLQSEFFCRNVNSRECIFSAEMKLAHSWWKLMLNSVVMASWTNAFCGKLNRWVSCEIALRPFLDKSLEVSAKALVLFKRETATKRYSDGFRCSMHWMRISARDFLIIFFRTVESSARLSRMLRQTKSRRSCFFEKWFCEVKSMTQLAGTAESVVSKAGADPLCWARLISNSTNPSVNVPTRWLDKIWWKSSNNENDRNSFPRENISSVDWLLESSPSNQASADMSWWFWTILTRVSVDLPSNKSTWLIPLITSSGDP